MVLLRDELFTFAVPIAKVITTAKWKIQNTYDYSELTNNDKRIIRRFRKIEEELAKELNREVSFDECFERFREEKKCSKEYRNYILTLMDRESNLPFREEEYWEHDERTQFLRNLSTASDED